MVLADEQAYIVAWQQYQNSLEEKLKPGPPLDAALETMRRPGKQLRPRLFLCAAGLDRLSPAAVHIAVGLELLHLASLIHDDLIDCSPQRRMTTSLWQSRGSAAALLCGDYFFSEAFAEFAAAELPWVIPLVRRLISGMVRAELEQESHLFQPDLPIGLYYRRIRLKTARFFAVAAGTGALASGCSSRAVRRVYRFGQAFGIAYQLADNIRDLFHGDVERGVLSLPLLWLARRHRDGRRILARICKSGRVMPGDMLLISKFLNESRCLLQTEKEIRFRLGRAAGCLQGLDGSNFTRLKRFLHEMRPLLLQTSGPTDSPRSFDESPF